MLISRITSIALLVWASACGGAEPSPEARPTDRPPLIAGIDADAPLRSRVARTTLSFESPIGTVVDELDTTDPLPLSWHLPAVEARTLVRVVVRVFDAQDVELLERVVHTNQPEDRTALLRIRLNDECLPGVIGRPIDCGTDTCVAGFCAKPHVNESALEDFDAAWAEPADGACVDDPDAPRIEIGDDGEPFTLMAAGTEHVPEWGIQGGTHIWLSVRSENLAPSGGVTYVAADTLDGMLGPVQKTDDVYVDGPDGCVLQHVRYILPGEEAYDRDMRLHVATADRTGNAAHATVDVFIADAPPPP